MVDMDNSSTNKKLKEGGYGWVIVGACFLFGVMTVDGYGSFGVFMIECVERFGMSEKYLPWIGAFRLSLQGFCGIVVGGLVQPYGHCTIAIGGTLLVVSSHIACGLFPQLGYSFLLLTYGIIPGIGFACMTVVWATAFQDYFQKKSGLANAIVSTGISAGFFLWSPLVEFLFSKYGWTGGLILNAAVHLHGLPLALLLIKRKGNVYTSKREQDHQVEVKRSQDTRYSKDMIPSEPIALHESLFEVNRGGHTLNPRSSYSVSDIPAAGFNVNHLKTQTSLVSLAFSNSRTNSYKTLANQVNNRYYQQIDIIDTLTGKNNYSENCSAITHRKDIPQTKQSSKSSDEIAMSSTCTTKCIVISTLKEIIDLSLFKNIPFLVYCIGLDLAYISSSVPFVLLPVRAVNCGIDRSAAAFLISIIGIVNAFSRLFWGKLSDIQGLSKYKPLISGGSAILDGVTSLMAFVGKDYISFAILAACWGFSAGGYTSLQNTLVVYILHGHNIHKGAGTLLTALGVAWFLSYVLCGLLIDLFGNATDPFYVFGSIEVLGGIVICSITCFTKR